MATAKFKDVSPYSKPKPTPPEEDYIHKKYLDAIQFRTAQHHSKLNVALIGVGRAGTIHLGNIVADPRLKLLYIVDDLESNWAKLKNHWHLENVTFLSSKHIDKVYSDPTIGAVIIASPTYTHEDLVTKALEAKKAVFCEKPIAGSVEKTMKCYDTAAKVGKPLFSAFNRRFDPAYSTVRQKVRNGDIGHVHVIKTVARDCPLPTLEYLKASGGIFHDCIVHDIDIITWTLGEYPIKVGVQAHAHIPEIKAIGDFDTVLVTLYFPSGTLGMIDVSRNANYGYDQRLEVFGPKGMLSADNERPMHALTKQYGVGGGKITPIWYSFPSRFGQGYRCELDHFIDVAHGKAKSSVQPKETLAVSKIASACEESVRTGNIVDVKWAQNELPEIV